MCTHGWVAQEEQRLFRLKARSLAGDTGSTGGGASGGAIGDSGALGAGAGAGSGGGCDAVEVEGKQHGD